ncbi:MAG: ScpA family protein [Patescibacteria group bacterium]
MNVYQLKTEKFSGPIEKLLELIEEKKMEITELSLAEVVADFLNYLKTIEKKEPRMLADFIVVASRLILIKSKALLPTLELNEEEKEDIKDLEERLRRYAEFKPSMAIFKKLFEVNNFSVSRQFLSNHEPIFYPADNFNVSSMQSAMKSIFEIFSQLTIETKKIEPELIKLEDKINEIIKKIESGIAKFSDVTKEKSRREIVILFLALLHLLKEQLIKVEQNEGIGDIIIKK